MSTKFYTFLPRQLEPYLHPAKINKHRTPLSTLVDNCATFRCDMKTFKRHLNYKRIVMYDELHIKNIS